MAAVISHSHVAAGADQHVDAVGHLDRLDVHRVEVSLSLGGERKGEN